MSDISAFVCFQLAGPYREFPFLKKCFLMWVCFGCGGIFACFDCHKIVILFFHVTLKVMPHTADRPSLLHQSAVAAEYASRAAVHVESYF